MKQKICGAASLAPNNVGVMSQADPPPISPVEESSAMSATTSQANRHNPNPQHLIITSIILITTKESVQSYSNNIS